MASIYVEAQYAIFARDCIELPEGKTWDDVEHVSVRYGTATLTMKDKTEIAHELSAMDPGDVDWKWPLRFTVHAADAEESPTGPALHDEYGDHDCQLPLSVIEKLKGLGYEVKQVERAGGGEGWLWTLNAGVGDVTYSKDEAWRRALMHKLEQAS
jgi:hypothetical protein